MAHNSEATEIFLEELIVAAMHVGVSGSIQCHDKKPKTAADQLSLNPKNNKVNIFIFSC